MILEQPSGLINIVKTQKHNNQHCTKGRDSSFELCSAQLQNKQKAALASSMDVLQPPLNLLYLLSAT
jgi:hypothetical protein